MLAKVCELTDEGDLQMSNLTEMLYCQLSEDSNSDEDDAKTNLIWTH